MSTLFRPLYTVNTYQLLTKSGLFNGVPEEVIHKQRSVSQYRLSEITSITKPYASTLYRASILKVNNENDTSLTFSHLQQIYRLRLWKHAAKYIEYLYKLKLNYWLELKTLWQSKNITVRAKSSFCHTMFKSHLLETLQIALQRGKVKTISNTLY